MHLYLTDYKIRLLFTNEILLKGKISRGEVEPGHMNYRCILLKIMLFHDPSMIPFSTFGKSLSFPIVRVTIFLGIYPLASTPFLPFLITNLPSPFISSCLQLMEVGSSPSSTLRAIP